MAFHWTQALLGEGAILQAGNYGRILVAAGYGHSQALRESVLEHVRETEFHELPSRLRSSYFFETHAQAMTYANEQKLAFYNLYEVEIVSKGSAIAEADFRRVQPVGALGLTWARSYWRGDAWHRQRSSISREVCRMRSARAATRHLLNKDLIVVAGFEHAILQFMRLAR